MKQILLRLSPFLLFYLVAALAGWSWNAYDWQRVTLDLYILANVSHGLTFWREIRRKWFKRLTGPTPQEVARRIRAISDDYVVDILTGRKGDYMTVKLQGSDLALYRMPVPRTYPQLLAVLELLALYADLNSLTHENA